MIMQTVINKETKKVLRYGYCDFEHDGSFDSENEEIIEKEWIFEKELQEVDYYWDAENEIFYEE
jgi:hypothetical protein